MVLPLPSSSTLRKYCPNFCTQFHPPIFLVLVFPEDIASYWTDWGNSLDIKGNPFVSVLILWRLLRGPSDLPYMFPESSRLNLVVTFSLQPPEWVTIFVMVPNRAELRSPPVLGILTIFWAILPSYLHFWPMSFPIRHCSPSPSLTSLCPTMTVHRWKTHTSEGMHFYGEGIPQWGRKCSRTG